MTRGIFAFTGFVAGGTLFIAASLVLAWTGPASAPPNGNVSAPINVGTTDQIKNAGLGINSLAVFGNAIISTVGGYINFGTVAGASGYGIRDNNGVIEFKNEGGEWTPIPTSGGSSNTSFTISSNANNVDLYVIAGSPAAPGDYTITINNGVVIGSGSTGAPALSSGTWPSGSTVTLVNNGAIYGRGGDGGSGGSSSCSQQGVQYICNDSGGGGGGGGGNAMSLGYDITIDNANGYIFGGGGGGAGGDGRGTYGGGGGGGGQGAGNSSGGSGGSGSSGGGNSGGPGTVSGPGGGGSGSNGNSGGSGGAWATAASGAAGKAIQLNGRTVTWQGGNNPGHLKGVVQ